MAEKPKPSENKAEKVETKFVTVKLTKEDVVNVLNIINGASFRGLEVGAVAVLKRKFEQKLQDGTGS